VIIGAHTHDLLPEGERIGGVLVAQAGQFGEHIGRIEIDGDSITATVEPVPADTAHDPAIAAEAARVEDEVAAYLAEPLGTIDRPLDAAFVAEILRLRMHADIGLFAEGPGPRVQRRRHGLRARALRRVHEGRVGAAALVRLPHDRPRSDRGASARHLTPLRHVP
jgi:hypothetical protein